MSLTKFLDPKNDYAFKRIFGKPKNEDILIHFLNDMLYTNRFDPLVFLALKLNKKPGAEEAHLAVKKQLKIFIPDDPDMSEIGLEKYLTRKSVLFLTDSILRVKYWQFHFDGDDFLHDLRT